MSPTSIDDSLVDRVLTVSGTFDPSNRLPLVIIDSTALPPPKTDLYRALVEVILSRLPKYDYSLLFFACGTPNKPSWTWVAKTYSLLDRHMKKRVKKVYIVHESWWIRAATEMLRGTVSSKFRRKLVHVPKLSELAKYLDITAINIPVPVYLHNLKVESSITVPRHHIPEFGIAIPMDSKGQMVVPKVWRETMQYLKVTAPFVHGIFNRLDETEKSLVPILRDAYDRGQLLDIDDYGPNVAAALLKEYAIDLPQTILPMESIALPVCDTKDYTMYIIRSIPYPSKVLIFTLFDVLAVVVANRSRTYHSSASLALCLAPCLIGRTSAKSKDNIKIAIRVIRNMIDHWPEITKDVDDRLRSAAVKVVPPLSQTPLSVSKHRIAGSHSSSSSSSGIISTNSTGRNISLPEVRSSELLADVSEPVRSFSAISLSSSSTESNTSSMAPPPPPPPRATIRSSASNSSLGTRTHSVVRKSRSMSNTNSTSAGVLQPSTKTNINTSAPTTPKKNNGSFGAVVPETPTHIRRGRIVAELAAFYEKTGASQQILLDLERDRKKWHFRKGIQDVEMTSK